MQKAPSIKSAFFRYLLHLADNALILSHRNSEWCAHGPVLEQDIAITNIALDLLGQARNFYQYAVALYANFSSDEKEEVKSLLPQPWLQYNRELTEDDLAFLRNERQYLNHLIMECPNGDWAQTLLRQFFCSVYQYLLYKQLQNNSDSQLAAIAEKSLKEITYHVRWSSEWVVRLGDGTSESQQRMEKALDELWMFTGEFFIPANYEMVLANEDKAVDPSKLKKDWLEKITTVFSEATLALPEKITNYQQGGKEGKHTEYLGYILSELQFLQRSYPDSNW